MGQRDSANLVQSSFKTDEDGNPTGGTADMLLWVEEGDGLVKRQVIFIEYQDGIVGEDGQTGAFVEDVIYAATQRLEFFQESRFECDENADALYHLDRALKALDRRTAKRSKAGIENTYEVS